MRENLFRLSAQSNSETEAFPIKNHALKLESFLLTLSRLDFSVSTYSTLTWYLELRQKSLMPIIDGLKIALDAQ